MEAVVLDSSVEKVTSYKIKTTFPDSSRITSVSSDLCKKAVSATESSRVEVTF